VGCFGRKRCHDVQTYLVLTMNYYQYNSFEDLVKELIGPTVRALVHDYRDRLTFKPTIFILPEHPGDAADVEDEIDDLSASFVGGFYNCWKTDWWFEKEEDAMMVKLRWLERKLN
jgi:hypothetical protein